MLNLKQSPAKLGLTVALAIGTALTVAAPAPAFAQRAVAPTEEITLSVGAGRLVPLGDTMADLFVANEAIADVQVRSNRQIFIFGRAAGQTTVYATDRSGRIIYSATIRVGQNLASVDDMLRLAMPEARIQASTMNGIVLLTGTVAQPSDAEEAQRLVQAFVGEATQVISRLRTATPQQVMLQVRFAEVSRSLVRNISTNITSYDSTGGFLFGIGRGNPGTIAYDAATGTTNYTINRPAETTTIGLAGRLLGLNLLGTANANEDNGLVNILAEPTLTALSGETASFLAGGEFPIPISQSLGTVSIEYKSYGVGLAFSPTVLENGRISMRVRPEVSELSSQGAIRMNGYEVPALTTRRTETTVELGSGQSMMISGLLRNTSNNTINRVPGVGNLPIIGALFRSNGFRRQETELVIIITPYLVQPMNANQAALPTDGFRAANDGQQLLLGQIAAGRTEGRPTPTVGAPRTITPGMTTSEAAPVQAPAGDTRSAATSAPTTAGAPANAQASARPGFEF